MKVQNQVFSLPAETTSREEFIWQKKAAAVSSVATVFFAGLTICAFAVFATGVLLSAPISLTLGAVSGMAALTALFSKKYFSTSIRSFVLHSPDAPKPHEVSPYICEEMRSSKVHGFPLVHSADTALCRKRMIAKAQHNVLLSGNYCGEKAFDEILELLDMKMSENPDFKVIILSAPKFVKDDPRRGYYNKRRLKELTERYPSQFQIIYNTNSWQTHSGMKYTLNHTKALSIDYGRYSILGGSAVKDNFAGPGVDHPHILRTSHFPFTEKNINQRLVQLELIVTSLKRRHPDVAVYRELKDFFVSLDPRTIETADDLREIERRIPLILEREPLFHEREEIQSSQLLETLSLFMKGLREKIGSATDSSLTAFFLPKSFRDMDFAFHDRGGDHSQGRLLHLQLLALSHRLQHLEKKPGAEDAVPYVVEDVYQSPAFTKGEGDRIEGDDVLAALLNETIPKQSDVKTKIPAFPDRCAKGKKKGRFKLLVSGPEHTGSDFSSALHTRFSNAKDEIVIDHMYFNPSPEIKKALIQAVKRGVSLKIITNDNYKGCPNSHVLFGPNNSTVISELLSELTDEEKERVSVFMYRQGKNGLHKKVVVVDKQFVIAGSSNFGYKSLVTSSDYEINFDITDKAFAEQTLEVCEEDERHCERIENPSDVSALIALRSYFYRVGAPIWG